MHELGSPRTGQCSNMTDLAFKHHAVYRFSKPLFPNAQVFEECLQLFQNVSLHSRHVGSAKDKVPRKTFQRFLVFRIPLFNLTDFLCDPIAAATQSLGLYRASLGLAVRTQPFSYRPPAFTICDSAQGFGLYDRHAIQS
jgi:hypothetical protein